MVCRDRKNKEMEKKIKKNKMEVTCKRQHVDLGKDCL